MAAACAGRRATGRRSVRAPALDTAVDPARRPWTGVRGAPADLRWGRMSTGEGFQRAAASIFEILSRAE